MGKNSLTDLLLSGKLILFTLTHEYILFFGCVMAAMIIVTSLGNPFKNGGLKHCSGFGKTWYAFEGWKFMVDESWSCQARGQNKSNLHMFGKCLNYTPAKWTITQIMLSGYFEEEKTTVPPSPNGIFRWDRAKIKKIKPCYHCTWFLSVPVNEKNLLGMGPKTSYK